MRLLLLGISGTGGVSTHTKALIKEFNELAIPVDFYNYYSKTGWRPGRKDPKTILGNGIKLYKISIGLFFKMLLKKKDFDICHIQASGPVGGFLPAVFGTKLSKIFNKKVIVTFHHSKTEKFLKEHSKMFEKVLSRCDAFIVVSDKQKRLIGEYIGKEHLDRIFSIPNGYDPEKLIEYPRDESRERLGLDDDVILYSNIAWVMEKKGHIDLIDALKKINEDRRLTGKRFKFKIIGKGPLLEKYRELVKKEGIDDIIEFLGYVSDEDMSRILSASDMFVLPSLEEGNPIVMFEALSYGLPFIGTDVGGIPEIIRDEDHGIIVGSSDPKALANALTRSMMKDWDRSKIKKYSKQFTWRRIAERTVEVYDKTI